MVTFLSLAILTCAFVILAPGTKAKILSVIYFLFLYFLLSGVEGFISVGKFSSNAEYAYLAVIEILLLIHLPLLFRMNNLDHKAHNIKLARDIFDKDIKHLTNSELHRHLEH